MVAERKESRITAEEIELDQVKYYIRKIAENPVPHTRTGAVLEEILGSAGKMLRARLLLRCAALGPDAIERRERLCIMAAMVELTHLASLVHDDIIDDAKLRRGRPSVQSRFGKDSAVYTGDFLISRVFSWGAREGLCDAVERLALTIEDMCLGEIGQAQCRFCETVTVEDYYANIRGKTAALFRTACGMGAAEAGCTDAVIDQVERFGEYLGIAFQIRDDLLDFSGGREIGKETHQDFREGIYTLPVLMALQSSEGRAALLPLMRASRERVLTEDEICSMEAVVVSLGGVEAAWSELRSCIAIGGALLDHMEDCTPVRELRRLWYALGKR